MSHLGGIQIKRLCVFILAAALCALAVGCNASEQGAGAKQSQVIQELSGEEATRRIETFTLYFTSADDPDKPYTERRMVSMDTTASAVDTAMAQLLSGPSDERFTSPIPQDVRMLQSEQAADLVTVHLSEEILKLESLDLLKAKVCITNTLAAITGVQYVSVMCDGKELTPIEGKTMSPMGLYSGTFSELYNRLQSTSPAANQEVALYFQDATRNYLVPEMRSVTVGEDAIMAVFNELKKGPNDRRQYTSMLATQVQLLSKPVYGQAPDGRSMVTIDLSRQANLDQSARSLLLVGSLVLSVNAVRPDIDYVAINVAGRPANEYMNGLLGESNLLRRATFESYIGNTVRLYFPSKDSKVLVAVNRTVDQGAVGQVSTLLEELFRGPQGNEVTMEPAIKALPVQVSAAEDILGIRIQDDLMTVNVSNSFLYRLSALSEAEQRATVYAIVNTLCSVAGITHVQFLMEGRQVATFGGMISFAGPLLPNVGMVYKERPYG
nr:GerMN domain-containing protein [Maliibacterium massiliense]